MSKYLNKKTLILIAAGILLAIVGYFLIGDIIGAALGALALIFGAGEKAVKASDERQAKHEAEAGKSSKAAQASHSEAVKAGRAEIEESSGKTLEDRFKNRRKS